MDHRLAEWATTLDELGLDESQACIAKPLVDLLGIDAVFVMRVNDRDDSARFDPEVAGVQATFGAEIAAFYGDGSTTGIFDVDAPQAPQRNRLLALGATDQLLHLPRERVAALGFTQQRYRTWCDEVQRIWPTWTRHGVAYHYQQRLLICEGLALVGYFNILHAEPLNRSQLAAVRGVLPKLVRRIKAEHRLGAAALDSRFLQAALNAIPWPTFVTSVVGRVLVANHAGELIARDTGVRDLVAASARGDLRSSRVTRIRERNGLTRFLIELPFTRRVGDVATMATRYALTPRETTVLGLLVSGSSQRAISIALKISQRTVEHHVAALLDKLDVPTVSHAVVKIGQVSR